MWQGDNDFHVVEREESWLTMQHALIPVLVDLIGQGDDVALLEAQLSLVLWVKVKQGLTGRLFWDWMTERGEREEERGVENGERGLKECTSLADQSHVHSVPPSLLPSAGWQSWNSVRQIVVLGLHGTLFVSLWFTLQFEYLCVWLGWDIITLQAVQAVLVRDTTLSDGEMTWPPPYCPVLFLAGACKGWGLQWLGLEGYRKSVYDT